MSFIIKKKSKSALNAKMVARKKKLGHEVSMAAMAASASDDLLAPMSLEQRPISSLKGLPKRVRKSDAVQVERVARSIKTFKQCAPILINELGEIANGHIVAQALQSLGQTHVWCAVINHLDEDERALLHVTLNRLAETGDWEIEGLGELLIHFEELDFDLGVTGFTLAEIDILTQSDSAEEVASDAPEDLEPQVDPVSVPGDLWLLGKHRLLCGDATKADSYATVLDGRKPNAVFTDMPWNIPIAGFVSGLGKVKHQDFQQGAGEMSDEKFAGFADTFHAFAAEHLAEGSAFYSCIDWRSHDVIVAAGKKAGLMRPVRGWV